MLSTLLLQMPASDGRETLNPALGPMSLGPMSLGPMSPGPSEPLPEAFAGALLAAAAKLSPKSGATSDNTPEPAAPMDSAAESTQMESQPNPLALLHTEQVRYQLNDLAWALPAMANSTATRAVNTHAESSDAGNHLPHQLPANGSTLPLDAPIQALPDDLGVTGAASSAIGTMPPTPFRESNLPPVLETARPASKLTAPLLTSSLTLQPTTPVPAQAAEPSLDEPQVEFRGLPGRVADERVESGARSERSISELEMAKSSIGAERPKILLQESTRTAAAGPSPVLPTRNNNAELLPPTSPPPAPIQASDALMATLEKVSKPVAFPGEPARGQGPMAVNGSALELPSVTTQRAEPQANLSASTSTAGTAPTPVLPPSTSPTPTDSSLVAVQTGPNSAPMEASAASVSALERSPEGAATQLRVLTLTQTDELGDKLGALLASIKHMGKSQLSIQLHPQELGRLEVRIAPGAEQALNVSITAQQAATRDLVEAHLHRLRSALDDHGYAEVHVEVGQDRDSATNSQQQQQSEEQPTWPVASAAGQLWPGSVSGTLPGNGLEHSQIAAVGPGIDAYA
ncbi:MAG: flagellar hook-length control protein FliK [Pseudomonadales bacterium]